MTGQNDNICKFIQTGRVSDSLNIINFVCEKESRFKDEMIITASYSLNLVIKGNGILHTTDGEYQLEKGDIFHIFPAQPYHIENTGNLQYIYISYIGQRGASLAERSGFTKDSPVYGGFDKLLPLWMDSIEKSDDKNIDVMCEGLLLYTISLMCRNKKEKKVQHGVSSGMIKVKSYIDCHYTDPELSVEYVGKKFGYNPKYLSSAFYRMVRTTFSKYLNDLRMRYAETLIQNGITSVKDISYSCGYRDSVYFSKVFKNYYGLSPKRYMSGK